MSRLRLCDSHCHVHLMLGEIGKYRDFLIVGVSEDLESSEKTLELSEEYDNIVPQVGIHPWRIDRVREGWVRKLEELIDRGARGIGEIGLDKVYRAETYNDQLPIFKAQIRLAREYGLPVNIHAMGAWREVLGTLLREDVEKAVIHWYVGPRELIRELGEAGYYISINPIVRVEEEHRKALEEAPIEMLLTESDSPYEYKEIKLKPELIRECIETIASLKKMPRERVAEKIYENMRNYLKL